MGDWKAVKARPTAPLELYHLKTDPKEAIDVAAQNPEVMKKIRDYLATARTEEQRLSGGRTPAGNQGLRPVNDAPLREMNIILWW